MKVGAINVDAGSGATVDLIGTDSCGSIVLTTGTGSSTGVEFTLLFDQSTTATLIGTNPTGMQHDLDLMSVNANARSVVFTPALTLGSNNVIIGFGVSISGVIADSTVYQFSYRIR